MPSWRRGQRPSEDAAGYMRAVVPLAAISKHCPCKAGWVHICDTLSEERTAAILRIQPPRQFCGVQYQERLGRATVALPIAHFSPCWFSAAISQSTKCRPSFSYLLTIVPVQVMVSPGRAMDR